MAIYKSAKLFFDKDNFAFRINRNDERSFRMFATPTFPKKFNIELLEISQIETPSDITIEVLINSFKQRLIQLYEFRTDFILQNGFFILDTKDKKQFQIEVPDPRQPEFEFLIKIVSEHNFKMTLYYSTDQQETLHRYEPF